MAVEKLPGWQKRQLRALGHALDPVITIGQHGLSESVIRETNSALDSHELIKVRLGTNSELERKDAFQELADRTGASLIQVIGRIGLLYRPQPDPEKRVIEKRLKDVAVNRRAQRPKET